MMPSYTLNQKKHDITKTKTWSTIGKYQIPNPDPHILLVIVVAKNSLPTTQSLSMISSTHTIARLPPDLATRSN